MYCIQLPCLSLANFKLEQLILQSVYVFHDFEIFKALPSYFVDCPSIDLPDASSW